MTPISKCKIARLFEDEEKVKALWSRVTKKLKCDTESGCWEWQGMRNSYGYGITSSGRKLSGIRVHRFVYQFVWGDLCEEKNVVLHACDNPACCNPQHLSQGTMKDNTHDMISKQRMSPPPIRTGDSHHARSDTNREKMQGTNNQNSRYTEEDVVDVYTTKMGVSAYMRKTGFDRNFYYNVRGKKTWKWLTDKIDKGEYDA